MPKIVMALSVATKLKTTQEFLSHRFDVPELEIGRFSTLMQELDTSGEKNTRILFAGEYIDVNMAGLSKKNGDVASYIEKLADPLGNKQQKNLLSKNGKIDITERWGEIIKLTDRSEAYAPAVLFFVIQGFTFTNTSNVARSLLDVFGMPPPDQASTGEFEVNAGDLLSAKSGILPPRFKTELESVFSIGFEDTATLAAVVKERKR